MQQLIASLEKKTLKIQLFFAISCGLLIMLFIGFNAINNIKILSDETNIIYQNYLLGISHLKEAGINLAHLKGNLSELSNSNNDIRSKAQNTIEKTISSVQEEIIIARELMIEESDKKLVADFDIVFAKYQRNIEQINTLILHEHEKNILGNQINVLLSQSTFMDTIESTDAILNSLIKNKENQALNAAQLLKETRKENQETSLLIMFFGLLLIGGSGVLVARTISKPIRHLQLTIEELASGNLDIEIPYTVYRNE
ncbi:MAG: hypothetical protein QG557_219, partial [Pseudomonadota bacterium]|nr:hypothetical protein [Pseudomonadota bacterium]